MTAQQPVSLPSAPLETVTDTSVQDGIISGLIIAELIIRGGVPQRTLTENVRYNYDRSRTDSSIYAAITRLMDAMATAQTIEYINRGDDNIVRLTSEELQLLRR